jgi:D-sedoheptulose 7-phosphate isomerase
MTATTGGRLFQPGAVATAPDPVRVVARYLEQLGDLTARVDPRAAAAVAASVVGAIQAGRTVFVAGNGGSASTASHIACDLIGTCAALGRRDARIVSLADNPAVLTALANDIGFAEVFARQLEAQATRGDLLLLLSVSAESPNLIRAAATARARGLRVVAAVGRTGSLVRHCDAWMTSTCADYGLTEDLHLALNHMVVRLLHGGEPRTC